MTPDAVNAPHAGGWRLPATALGALLAPFLSMGNQAAVINYEASNLGGDTWRYDYTVTNDGSTTALVGLWDILFDTASYAESSLSIVSSPALAAAWDERILGSGLLIPAAYDVAAISGGIATGQSRDGFAVQFRWLGAGTPGPQPFQIFDPNTFGLLGSGTTAVVPLPATIWLLATGVAALAGRRRFRR
jgi:hypothetical protein